MRDASTITSMTESIILIDGSTRDPGTDVCDPKSKVFIAVDNDKFDRENISRKPPLIKVVGGSADPKAPAERYLRALARGCGYSEPFEEVETANPWSFPAERIARIAADVRLQDRITQDDIDRAAQGVADWRNGKAPTLETRNVIAAGEAGEEGGILVIWKDLLTIYRRQGNDKFNRFGVHEHRWSLGSPLTTNHALHPEILCNGWVAVGDLMEVIEYQSNDRNSMAWIDQFPPLQRIKEALLTSDAETNKYIENIRGVVSSHAEAFLAAQRGARDEVSCRARRGN